MADETEKMRIVIEETETIEGYKLLEGQIVLVVEKEGDEYVVNEIETGEETTVDHKYFDGWEREGDIISFNVKNELVIDGKLDLKILKRDLDGEDTLDGAEFRVTITNVKSVNEDTSRISGNEYRANDVPTNEDGELWINGIEMANENDPEGMKIIIEETKTVWGYKLPRGIIVLNVMKENGEFIAERSDETTMDARMFVGHELEEEVLTLDIRNEIEGEVYELNLMKKDDNGQALGGVKFSVEIRNVTEVAGEPVVITQDGDGHGHDIGEENVYKKDDLTTNSTGRLSLTDIVIADDSKPIDIIIEEMETVSGYKRIQGTINITVVKEGGRYNIVNIYADGADPEEFNPTFDVNEGTNTVELTLTNMPAPTEISILKTESGNGRPLSGATFILTFTNVKAIGSPREKDPRGQVSVTTGSNGRVDITGIELINENAPATVTIVEIRPPAGYKIPAGTGVGTYTFQSGDKVEISRENTYDPPPWEIYKLDYQKRDANVQAVGPNGERPKIDITVTNPILGVKKGNVINPESKLDFNLILWEPLAGQYVTPVNGAGTPGTSAYHNCYVNEHNHCGGDPVVCYGPYYGCEWDYTMYGMQEGTITIDEIWAPQGYKKIIGKITVTVKREGWKKRQTGSVYCGCGYNPDYSDSGWIRLKYTISAVAENTILKEEFTPFEGKVVEITVGGDTPGVRSDLFDDNRNLRYNDEYNVPWNEWPDKWTYTSYYGERSPSASVIFLSPAKDTVESLISWVTSTNGWETPTSGWSYTYDYDPYSGYSSTWVSRSRRINQAVAKTYQVEMRQTITIITEGVPTKITRIQSGTATARITDALQCESRNNPGVYWYTTNGSSYYYYNRTKMNWTIDFTETRYERDTTPPADGDLGMLNRTFEVNDIPIIRIGGEVWLDEEQPDPDYNKYINPPNGEKGSNERKVEGIRVRLYAPKDKKITETPLPNGTLKPIFGEKDPDGPGYQVISDLYGNDLTEIRTDSNGRYQFGGPVNVSDWNSYGIEKGTDYYVLFEYDGVNYETTVRDVGSEFTDSDASEVERERFNTTFQNISGVESGVATDFDKSYGLAGSLPLEYNDEKIKPGDANDENYRSYLITTQDRALSPAQRIGTNRLVTGDLKEQSGRKPYSMYASTSMGDDGILVEEEENEWRSTWDDGTKYMSIDMGLVERIFMLGLSKDVYEAKATINGKETTYTYNELMEADKSVLYGTFEDREGKTLTKIENKNTHDLIKYNMSLQVSDYNFKISDYQGSLNGGPITHDSSTATNVSGFVEKSEALRIFVTYSILLTNYGMEKEVKVNEIVDYFDPNYEFKQEGYTYYNEKLQKDVHIDSIVYAKYTGYNRSQTYNCEHAGGAQCEHVLMGTSTIYPDPQVTIGATNKAIAVKNVPPKDYKQMTIPLGEEMGGGGQQIVWLTFEVTPNRDENETTPIPILGEGKDEYNNLADITKYWTQKGFVDKNAAPKTLVANNSRVHFERHSDEAPGFIIKLMETIREISGIVWDDYKPNNQANSSYYTGTGRYGDDDDELVNDVIVQLVEIKDLFGTGTKYEYIWQEMRTNSDKVKRMNNQGDGIYDYSVPKGDGKYTFQGYIPGDYIIRFIYGDGTTYDVTKNVREYNGQDYQSTIDKYYQEANFNYETHKTEGRLSDARDNEARRLQVMAYSALVDSKNGLDMHYQEDEALRNTWMCAETSQILIPLEENAMYNGSYDANSSMMDSRAWAYYKNQNEVESDGDVVGGFDIYGNREYLIAYPSKTFNFTTTYLHKVPNIDFGIQLRPRTLLELEKHLVGVSINTGGIPILDVRAKNKEDVKNKVFYSKYGIDNLMLLGWTDGGARGGLSTRSTRGQWYFQTDLDELGRNANLEATYQYVIRNYSEVDYLSKELVDEYEATAYSQEAIKEYITSLNSKADSVKGQIREGLYYTEPTKLGTYLGPTYYTGVVDLGKVKLVSTRAEIVQEAVNPLMEFSKASGLEDSEENVHFKVAEEAGEDVYKPVYKRDSAGALALMAEKINTIVQTRTPTKNLTRYTGNAIGGDVGEDISKELILTTALNVSGPDDELVFDSYIAEIFTYSNAAGRRDAGTVDGTFGRADGSKAEGAVPGNLAVGDWKTTITPPPSGNDTKRAAQEDDFGNIDGGSNLVQGYDPEINLTGGRDPESGILVGSYLGIGVLEHDEFWGESIKITKPTGATAEIIAENNTNMTVLVVIPALAIMGVSVVLIRKFVFIK